MSSILNEKSALSLAILVVVLTVKNICQFGWKWNGVVLVNSKTRECLTKAGWYEGRKANITGILRGIENAGYIIFDE